MYKYGIVVAAAIALSSCGTNTPVPSSQTGESQPPRSCMMDAAYSSVIRDKRKFVAKSDNVFVATVEESAGQHIEEDGTPHSQFNVKVLSNLKGTLPESVTVSQNGGIINNVQCLLNHDPLLTPGTTYIFTTKYAPTLKFHFITAAEYGDIKLSTADATAVKNGLPDPPPVAEMRAAVGG